MQLLIILALLLCGENKGGKNLLEDIKPVLENFGGDEIKEALKNAEEITSALSAARAFAGAENIFGGVTSGGEQPASGAENAGFPLSPINNIADRDIAYSLSKYIEK